VHIQLQFNGETTAEVVEQMRALLAVYDKPAADKPVTEKPARAAKAEKTKPAAETPPSTPETKPAAAVDEMLAKQQAEAKEWSLVKARELFALGTEGQAKVRSVTKEFGVKKLSEVPVENALRLRELIGDAEQELKAAASKAADAGDAI
jgi:hypothetical protein